MEFARDLVNKMQREGREGGIILNQFSSLDNPSAHYETIGPKICRDTKRKITHFISSMSTTVTIMGVSRYLRRRGNQR